MSEARGGPFVFWDDLAAGCRQAREFGFDAIESEGVIHFCVPNLTAAVARTASHALTNAALPYILSIGEYGVEGAIENNSTLRKGVKMYQGKIVSHRLADALGRQVEIDLVSS